MAVLARMGLANPDGNGWNLRADYLQVLKTMQQAGDRQKMLHQYGILLSDPRIPTQVTRARDIGNLEGRVLAHVYDDATGAPQMILEGTDAHVHFIRHTPLMEQMRQAGSLRPNSFVSLTRIEAAQGEQLLKIVDHGDAETYLSSRHMRKSANRLIQRGIIANTEYGGWLGKYHRTLAQPDAPAQATGKVAQAEKQRGR